MSLSLGMGMRIKSKDKMGLWSPAKFGSSVLKVWLETGTSKNFLNSDDPAVAPSTGNEITRWIDLSGNGSHATADGGTTVDGFVWTVGSGVGYVHSSGTEQMILPQFEFVAGTDQSIWTSFYFKNGTTINSSDVIVNDADTSTADRFRIKNTTSIDVKISGSNNTYTISAETPGYGGLGLQDETWYVIGFERAAGSPYRTAVYVNGVVSEDSANFSGTFDFDRFVGGNGVVLGGLLVIEGHATTADEKQKIYEYFTRETFTDAP